VVDSAACHAVPWTARPLAAEKASSIGADRPARTSQALDRSGVLAVRPFQAASGLRNARSRKNGMETHS
jgi:hypothetical protein